METTKKGKIVDINNYADREKIELCYQALIYAIAFFRGYHRDHSQYPIVLLDDLKDLLEDLMNNEDFD